MNLGGKGSGRPKGSTKPLSKVFSGLCGDVVDLEMKLVEKKIGVMYEDFNALKSKINYHIRKHKLKEYRRKIKELGK